jgi:hypothetical protein
MINFVIAIDDQNPALGVYFEDCKNDIVALLDEQKRLVKSSLQIASNQCSEVHINSAIPPLNSNPFIFIAYTHGADNGLRCNGAYFVSVNNCHHFANSLFYSTACFIGKKLAPELINKGCKTFIGFIEDSNVIFENPIDKKVFIDSDNFGIKMFLTSNVTIGESFEAMRNFYTQKIDYYQETLRSPLIASCLVTNREALICLGNKNLKKEDLFLSE